MEYNLSYTEVLFRYLLMAVMVIVGGVMGMLPIMLLGLPFFLTGILGWCPIYSALGINHAYNAGKH
ncbi:hypothetical protein BH09BAC1_BH09BAC1_06820 [soil metagenome]